MAKLLALIAVTALVTVEHDLVKYGPGQEAGDEFECTEEQATALENVGAVKRKAPAEAAEADAGGGAAATKAATVAKKK